MASYRTSDLSAAHLADRYGTTLAIRWPEDVSDRIDRIKVIQDVFFGVSAYLLDDDDVWAQRVSAETVGYGGIPDGSIRNGIVMVGKDKGRPLFAK